MNKKTIQLLGILFVIVLIAVGLSKASKHSGAVAQAGLPAVTASDWSKGPETAALTIIEYGDYQCPACGVWHPLVEKMMKEEEGKVRLVFRNFPLSQLHPNALAAAHAAEAAGAQGKYWEMHNMLFENQEEWTPQTEPTSKFEAYATKIGLDLAKFDADMKSDAIGKKISSDYAGGAKVGIQGTPTFFLNGEKLDNTTIHGYDDFKKQVDAAYTKANEASKSHISTSTTEIDPEKATQE